MLYYPLQRMTNYKSLNQKKKVIIPMTKNRTETKEYTFKKETRETCASVSLNHLGEFTPVYPGLLLSLDPETINFSVWIKGSKEIIEFVTPNLLAESVKKKIGEVLKMAAKTQSITQLLIQKNEQNKFFKHLDRVRKEKIAKLALSDDEKELTACFHSLTKCAGHIKSFIDPHIAAQAEQVAISVVESVCKVPTVFSYLTKLLAFNPSLYEHATFVGLLATAIAQKIGLSFENSRIIPLGCMYMDIGLTRLDIPDLFTKPLNPESTKRFERHPIVGIDILNEIEAEGIAIPDGVFQITLQHHEKFNGQGFPNNKKGRKGNTNPHGINIYALIVGIADKFVSYFNPLNAHAKFTELQAIRSINRLADDFDPAVLKVFNELITISSEEIAVADNKKWITEW